MTAGQTVFVELEAADYRRVAGLFAPLEYSLSVRALIAGMSPGRIFVDDPGRPRVALALTVEGYLLAGDPDDAEAVQALQRFFTERILTGEVSVNGDWSISLAVYPEAWETRLSEIIPTHEAEKLPRTCYLCVGQPIDRRQRVPADCSVCKLDLPMWEGRTADWPDVVRQWSDPVEMWGSAERMLALGVSHVALHGGQVVAWCAPDCAAGERIDVGVFTHPAHRRRGLATCVAAATVEACRLAGYRQVGWHCNVENVASWRTAERVGMQRSFDYAYYYYMRDPIDHLAELGWYHYRHGRYDQTVRYYERVFAQRDDNPDYYYHLAASAHALLGDGERALARLQDAVAHGWSNGAYTAAQEDFAILHGRPEWGALMALLGSGGKA